MAKIQIGNWNDLPWMSDQTKVVNGKSTCETKIFGTECQDIMCAMRKIENGMPIDKHCHKNEQITFCLEGECDVVISGVPYRLTAGSWVNIPPYYEHYTHVYRTSVPCVTLEIFTPQRESLSEPYAKFVKDEYGILLEEGGINVKDLAQPLDPDLEVR